MSARNAARRPWTLPTMNDVSGGTDRNQRGTGSGTGAEPGGTSSGTVRYSVPQAARRLGISERAVRKRIAAGTLHAERAGGRWWVWLEPEPVPEPGGTGSGTQAEPDGTDAEPIEARYRVTPAEIEHAIERTGARYVADMRTLFAELDARYERLYRDQLEAKDGLIAELRRRAEVAEAERDQLRADLRAHQAATPADPPQRRPWWRLWQR